MAAGTEIPAPVLVAVAAVATEQVVAALLLPAEMVLQVRS